MRARVVAARERQLARAGKPNAALSQSRSRIALHARCRDSHALLDRAIERLGLSARAYHRVLRVARTIADLAGRERIDATHLLGVDSVSAARRELVLPHVRTRPL